MARALFLQSLNATGGASFAVVPEVTAFCRRPITEYELDRTDPGTAAALASRQKGSIDPTLAGLVAFGAVCALLVARWPL